METPIRFARLGYCRLHCSDLAASTAFYRDLVGLTLENNANGEVWLRCSDKPYDMILQQGDEAGIAGAGFEMENVAELEKAFARLEKLGTTPRWLSEDECRQRRVARALTFVDPVCGLGFEFYADQDKVAPYHPPHTKIARMGHLVLNVADLDASHDFWVNAMGFAVSDRVDGLAEWLRCWPNPLHHSFALLQGDENTANTLHHINFMVTDIDDVGGAMHRMKAANVPIVFGPGRHLPSTSIFLYFLDPDGNTTEYSFGMELFEEEGARGPRELEHKAEVMDIWGSRPDPRFGKGNKVLAAHV